MRTLFIIVKLICKSICISPHVWHQHNFKSRLSKTEVITSKNSADLWVRKERTHFMAYQNQSFISSHHSYYTDIKRNHQILSSSPNNDSYHLLCKYDVPGVLNTWNTMTLNEGLPPSLDWVLSVIRPSLSSFY